ncbi:MAG: hypothetical protein IPH09_16810 [bacterium]|nr:hypothetical protein [bacterium]
MPGARRLAPDHPRPLASLLSLSAHLLAVYPVPAFLVKALIVSDDADSRRPGTAQLFDHLAQGGSMRKAVDLGLVPYPSRDGCATSS